MNYGPSEDIQAVIFAAGKGSRMTQLLSGKPKCLLSIGGKLMIQYPLELLIRSNIKGKQDKRNKNLLLLFVWVCLFRNFNHRIGQ